MHIHVWTDGKQFDLLPREAVELERAGVIELSEAEPRTKARRTYSFADDHIAFLCDDNGRDIDWDRVWDDFYERIDNIGEREKKLLPIRLTNLQATLVKEYLAGYIVGLAITDGVFLARNYGCSLDTLRTDAFDLSEKLQRFAQEAVVNREEN